MGSAAINITEPHFFLLRTFLGQNDLLIIFNTKRCRYRCFFCELPAKSSKTWIETEAIAAQFEFAVNEVKHALSIIDRVTLSNEGSVFDSTTFPQELLLEIAEALNECRRVRSVVLETRLEFVEERRVRAIQERLSRASVNILTGFETLDQEIRDNVLHKNEPLKVFLKGLDRLGSVGADLTAYILYKPDPSMTDRAAYDEALRSVEFLANECAIRDIALSLRLNPMYVAKGSPWAKRVERMAEYLPPRLTDCMKLAEEITHTGLPVYIGLSTEGLGEEKDTYMAREDYDPQLIKAVKTFNDHQVFLLDSAAGYSTARG